jgi:glyceraldehyde 3-phosphate dehydrogenase
MIKIGINGFGRIGKCLFLQLLENPIFSITCINAPNILLNEIEDYLRYDTIHKHNIPINVKLLDNDMFEINNHKVKLFKSRDAKQINWNEYNVDYLFEATGAYLTSEKCKDHNVPYTIISAPPKDSTPTYIYSVNHNKYNGEKIVSGSSCTTNSISPILQILNDNYKIKNCVFTTIHAATASQYVVDVQQKNSRINRSIFNNIIPYTTGASSSIINVIPELDGKLFGTSIRVPVANCSLIDMNIELENTNITLDNIIELLKDSEYYNVVYNVINKNLVSSDFNTTTTPTIIDVKASISMGEGKFKLFIWYDNEWSYSRQLIRMVEFMYKHNNCVKEKYYFENLQIENKRVVCRLDFNVPVDNDKNIIDDFRIVSAIPTIETILSKNPKYIILTSHFGRPKENEQKYSLKFLIPVLEKYLKKTVYFLEDGLSETTLNTLQSDNSNSIYLLENLRFHKEETKYETNPNACEKIANIYNNLGDVFICDAFGCLHRKHLSIYSVKFFNKSYGYGALIKKELEEINKLISNKSNSVLGIIGGNKINDKLPIINSLKKIPNSKIFIAGGLAKHYNNTTATDNEFIMYDGYGAQDLESTPEKIQCISISNLNVYDIGKNSLQWLKYYIENSNIIFWNGSLGVIEHEEYKKGSLEILNYLYEKTDKTIIIGGGETASLIKNKKQYQNIYVSTGGGALLEYIQHKILYNSNIVGLEIYI